jgi:lipopolysaccharide/colanic/teichoic acid biosynthesis glycosyltransferase
MVDREWWHVVGGPRPERPVSVERFRAEAAEYDERHRMPVGLTSLAQIVALRGDTSIAERVKYDDLYIDQWSVGIDL